MVKLPDAILFCFRKAVQKYPSQLSCRNESLIPPTLGLISSEVEKLLKKKPKNKKTPTHRNSFHFKSPPPPVFVNQLF